MPTNSPRPIASPTAVTDTQKEAAATADVRVAASPGPRPPTQAATITAGKKVRSGNSSPHTTSRAFRRTTATTTATTTTA
jgi:hypothetical protein